jgi:hypothetical protein
MLNTHLSPLLFAPSRKPIGELFRIHSCINTMMRMTTTDDEQMIPAAPCCTKENINVTSQGSQDRELQRDRCVNTRESLRKESSRGARTNKTISTQIHTLRISRALFGCENMRHGDWGKSMRDARIGVVDPPPFSDLIRMKDIKIHFDLDQHAGWVTWQRRRHELDALA